MEQEKKTTTLLSKDECVKIMTILMRDILDAYHQYNPEGTYLSLAFLGDSILIHDDPKDKLCEVVKFERDSNDK